MHEYKVNVYIIFGGETWLVSGILQVRSLPAWKSRTGGFEHAWTRSGLIWVFHNDHEVMAHISRSFPPSLCTIHRASMKNFFVTKLLFCSLPQAKAHTLQGNGHSHRICCVVSSCCPQMEHLASICTFRRARLVFVGRTLQHALHIKVLNFGGTFWDHSFFLKRWSWEAEECSPDCRWLSRSATWYAVFTVNSRDLFSFYVNQWRSWNFKLGRARLKDKIEGRSNLR